MELILHRAHFYLLLSSPRRLLQGTEHYTPIPDNTHLEATISDPGQGCVNGYRASHCPALPSSFPFSFLRSSSFSPF